MAEDQSDKAPVHQDVAAGSDVYAAGRDLQARLVQVPVSGSQGVQAGEGNTQVNNYFLDRDPATQPSEAVAGAAGRLLSDVTDPFDLEVHRPVPAEAPQSGLPVLPAYVSRFHDRQLSEVTQAAASGKSGLAVLVGGSSTGKTRACWEALELLREQPGPWRLWHPIDPARPDAALRELPGIGPRTVVWLNEAQFYLAAVDGEKVAAGLRSLLRDPARAPVLVLATLWPEYWGQLAVPPAAGAADPHAQARELLTGRDITIPAALTAAQVQEAVATGDPRLALAAAKAGDGRVVQFLAGAPELVSRYETAPAAERALLDAAIDARRLGMGAALPRAFLEEAAPGYIADADWDALPGNWLEEALAATGIPAKGVRGPLALGRPRPGAPAGTDYRLADYLEQHGRRTRRACIPPAAFWTAAAQAQPQDFLPFSLAAHDRGLLRTAGLLYKRAAASDPNAACCLVSLLAQCRPDDHRPAEWAARHVPVHEARAVASLLKTLQAIGALAPVSILAGRAAAEASLGDPRAVAVLLGRLTEAGAREQADSLAARAAGHVPLDDPRGVSALLSSLLEQGAKGPVATLLARDPAGHAAVDEPYSILDLLGRLSLAGARQQVHVLASRAAAHVLLDDPGGVAVLLRGLLEQGESQQATILARRAAVLDGASVIAGRLGWPGEADEVDTEEQLTALLARDQATRVCLEEPFAAALLLADLRAAGAYDQVTALLARDPAAHASLDNLQAVAGLLEELRAAEADEQAVILAGRAAAHGSLNDPGDVAVLLAELVEADSQEQITVLAARAAASAPLDNPRSVAALIRELRAVGARGQLTQLLARDPAASAALDDPRAVASLLSGLLDNGAREQAVRLAARAAAGIPLDDPDGVASLLRKLREADMREQGLALAARSAGHSPLANPNAVASLLRELWRAGACDPASSLAARAAADAPLGDLHAVARLLGELRETDMREQAIILAGRAAAHAPLDIGHAVASLLDELSEGGMSEQVTLLVGRLPAEGLFDLFCTEANNQITYRFGREPNGNPARPWRWDDIS